MRRAFAPRTALLFPTFLLVAALSAAAAQVPKPLAPNEPLPKGQQIEAKDGDTVVIRGDARVRLIRRSEARVRAIYNSAERWLVVLADFADAGKGAPDGAVDSIYTFHDLDDVWPLGERWQGSTVIEEYSIANTAAGSYGITTDGVSIQLFSGSPADVRWFADPRAVALRYHRAGRRNSPPGRSTQTFDDAEQEAIAEARGNAQRGDGSIATTMPGSGGTTMTSRVGMTVPNGAAGTRRSGEAPVRVGSRIAQPMKTVDAKAVMPPAALQGNVRGVVIVEIVIGSDGAVTDATILRSIPLLDQAALDAVRQWRYTPTIVDGRPVPVIMTVTVAFP
jgi:TonB family protein